MDIKDARLAKGDTLYVRFDQDINPNKFKATFGKDFKVESFNQRNNRLSLINKKDRLISEAIGSIKLMREDFNPLPKTITYEIRSVKSAANYTLENNINLNYYTHTLLLGRAGAPSLSLSFSLRVAHIHMHALVISAAI